MCANFGSIPDCLGNVSDERASFGPDFAALDAEPAIDAVRPIPMRSGKNCDRPPGTNANPEFGATLDEHIADSAQWMRSIRIAVRVTPGKVGRAGDRDLTFQQFVIGLQFFVADRPVGAYAILRVDAKIRRMETRCEGRPVNRTSAHAFAAIVLTERQRVGSPRDPKVVPVEIVRALLVANPVEFRIPKRTSLQPYNLEPSLCQSLQEYAARRTDSDDAVVDLFFVPETLRFFRDPLQRPKISNIISSLLELAKNR